jgi:radical SAM superfamily enzyme YgiQ (UPF0313 family)
MMVDLLLINPRYHLLEEPIQENLGLGYIASYIRSNGHTVEVLDASIRGMSHRRFAREIMKRDFKILGVTIIYQGAAKEQLSILKILRNKGLNAHVSVGGYFPTLAHRQLMEDVPEIDSVVRGEGEEALLELIRRLEKGEDLHGVTGLSFRDQSGEIVDNRARPLIEDLDNLPYPARDELPMAFERGGSIPLLASRGCYAICSYCSISSFYRKSKGPAWRGRGPENILDELQMLLETYNMRRVRFEDANFFGPGRAGRRRIEELAEGILTRGLDMEYRIECRAENVDEGIFRLLKKAGLKEVFVGIESAVPSSLEAMKKGVTLEENLEALDILDKLNIRTGVGFITMEPDTTTDEFFTNIKFIVERVYPMKKRLGSYVDPLSKLQVFAGTPLHKELEERGILTGDIYEIDYRFLDPKFRMFFTLFQPVQKAVYGTKSWLKRRRITGRREF